MEKRCVPIKEGKPKHIITAWSREDGFSLGHKVVNTKSNEITAIPELLDKFRIKGQVVTIDVMGTQTAIAGKNRSKHGDYVLALKENQRMLHEYVSLFLNDAGTKEELRKRGKYKKTLKKPIASWKSENITRQKKLDGCLRRKSGKGLKVLGWKKRQFEKMVRRKRSSVIISAA